MVDSSGVSMELSLNYSLIGEKWFICVDWTAGNVHSRELGSRKLFSTGSSFG